MALQFTRQQLVGGASYNPKTRVGNWNEDVELEQWNVAQYRNRRDNGEFISAKIAELHQQSMRQVGRHVVEEGAPLLFGDTITLGHTGLDGLIAVDTGAIKGTWGLCVVKDQTPRARSVFQIRRPMAEGNTDPEASFGEPVGFSTPFILVPFQTVTLENGSTKCAIACKAKNYEHLARISSESPIYLEQDTSKGSMWMLQSGLTDKEAAWVETASEAPAQSGRQVHLTNVVCHHRLACSSKFNFRGKVSEQTEYEVFAQPKGPPQGEWVFSHVDMI